MAELLQCDVCKKISPDEQGYFIANDWTKITTTDHFGGDKYLICVECMGKGFIINDEGVRP
jgi:hypothetical protein